MLSLLLPSVETTTKKKQYNAERQNKQEATGMASNRITSERKRKAPEKKKKNITQDQRDKEDIKWNDLRQIVRHLQGEKVSVSDCRVDLKQCLKRKEGKFKYEGPQHTKQVGSKPYVPPVKYTTHINT